MLLIFSVFYFGFSLPLFQFISRKRRGRKFVIRLGTPWKVSDSDQRWDVLMSVLSFILALAISLYFIEFVISSGVILPESSEEPVTEHPFVPSQQGE